MRNEGILRHSQHVLIHDLVGKLDVGEIGLWRTGEHPPIEVLPIEVHRSGRFLYTQRSILLAGGNLFSNDAFLSCFTIKQALLFYLQSSILVWLFEENVFVVPF